MAKHVLDERIAHLKRLPIEFVQDTYIGLGGDKTVDGFNPFYLIRTMAHH